MSGVTDMSQNVYQVVGECVHVTEPTALGPTKVLRYKGAIVRSDAPELKHLLSAGLVAKVGGEETGGVNADGVTTAEARGDVNPSGAFPAEQEERRTPEEVRLAAEAATTAYSAEPSAQEKAAAELAGQRTEDGKAAADEPSEEDKAAAEVAERRQVAREKLAKLDGKAPDGRHHEDVLVEYLVAQGGNYDDLARAEKSELVELVKARQS